MLFVWPSTGPLLLMTLRMLDDLSKFLILGLLVVIAFACSFYVLLVAALNTAEGSMPDVALTEMMGLLVEGVMNAEPVHVLDEDVLHAAGIRFFTWGLMAAFGVTVVMVGCFVI